jgi:hypothetical protein
VPSAHGSRANLVTERLEAARNELEATMASLLDDKPALGRSTSRARE